MKKSLIFLLFVASIMVSCGVSEEEQRKISHAERLRLQREDSLALKIAVMPTLDCLPIYIAKDCNMFDTLGVDVRLRKYTAQMDCDTAILGGSVEGLVTDIVRAKRMQTEEAKDLYLLSTTNCYWQLIANQKARIKNLKQLSDKMVAMTRYSATDWLTDYVLRDVNTASEVFRVQINDVNIRLNMLLNNEMDAMWLSEPQATVARRYGNNVLFDSKKTNLKFGVVAFAKNCTTDKHRQKQLEGFKTAYNMACDSINANGFMHYEAIIRKYYKLDEKTMSMLPKLKYSHITKPRNIDLNEVKKTK